jgi:hypothetical protein
MNALWFLYAHLWSLFGRRSQFASRVYLYLVTVGPRSADAIAEGLGLGELLRGGCPRENVDRALAQLARKHQVGEVVPGLWAALVVSVMDGYTTSPNAWPASTARRSPTPTAAV